MAGKSRQSHDKRQRERAKQERQARKRARREGGDEPEVEVTETVDEAALLEEFRVLSERREAGGVNDEDFEAEKARLFEALGLGEY